VLYRNRKPNRLKDYNYSNENLYFVTVCVNDRINCFGDIDNKGKMQINDYGVVANNQWEWLCKQFPYTFSHAFVVMPNHVHGILEINRGIVGTGRDLSEQNNNINNERTGHDLSLQEIPQKIKSISELIGAYKTTTSKQIHLLGYSDFKWQRSFHDHIIRNESSYQKIVDYIQENPQKWENDKYFSNS
jgi:putative transposase